MFVRFISFFCTRVFLETIFVFFTIYMYVLKKKSLLASTAGKLHIFHLTSVYMCHYNVSKSAVAMESCKLLLSRLLAIGVDIFD